MTTNKLSSIWNHCFTLSAITSFTDPSSHTNFCHILAVFLIKLTIHLMHSRTLCPSPLPIHNLTNKREKADRENTSQRTPSGPTNQTNHEENNNPESPRPTITAVCSMLLPSTRDLQLNLRNPHFQQVWQRPPLPPHPLTPPSPRSPRHHDEALITYLPRIH